MARKPFVIEVGPFEEGGMNTGKAIQLLGPAEAQSSFAVDYSDGTLKSFYLPGTVVGSPIAASASTAYLHYRDGAASPWRTSIYPQFTCLDGCYGLNAYGISYYTNNTTTPARLLWAAGPNVTDVPLGLDAPAAPSVTAAGSGAVRSYRVTRVAVYTDSGITVESNPSPAVTPTGSSGCTLTFAAATPADTAGITNYTYVYASQLGATATNPGVVYFLVATRPAGTTTHSDASLPFLLDATGALTQLTWQAGGTPSNQQVLSPYVYDHSPAPNAYVVANALMGANASSLNSNGNQARGGILFAAYGSTLYFSRSGMPWYFPLINAEVLDDTIEAIVVNQSSAYVLTQSSAYLVTGYDDTNLSITRTQAKHGCAPRCGQGAILTPHGIVYPSPLGLAVLDATGNGTVGTTSRILTQDFLSYGFTKSTSGAVGYGAYQDDVYIYAEGPGLIYLFDFAAWPRVRTTRFDGVTLPIVALARVHPFSSSSAKGLYALINNGNGTLSPCPWWPRLGFQLSPAASPAPWSHLTGALTAGTTNKKKRFTRFWLGSNTAADVTLTFTCSNWDGSLAGQLVNVTASSWLPSAFTGDYMTVNIISSVGTDVFESLRIEGEVYE